MSVEPLSSKIDALELLGDLRDFSDADLGGVLNWLRAFRGNLPLTSEDADKFFSVLDRIRGLRSRYEGFVGGVELKGEVEGVLSPLKKRKGLKREVVVKKV